MTAKRTPTPQPAKKSAGKGKAAPVRKAAVKAKPVGRPSSFTQETADTICSRIANGESLRTICASETMPAASTVFKWLAERKDFSEQYARAREDQADFYAEQIVEIADEEVTMIKRGKHQPGGSDEDDGEVEVAFDPTAVARNRLRVDARKWYASKLAPKKYGEKVAIGGADDLPAIKGENTFALSTDALLAIAGGAK